MQSPITGEKEGVQLTKYCEQAEFEHPAVVYEFESLRVEPVSIRLTATIPDQIRPTDVGFHSAHGCENWQVSDEKLHFEYELDGDAAYRTVCTVKPDAPIDATELITSPDEFTVDPPAEMVRGGSSPADAQESAGASTADAGNDPDATANGIRAAARGFETPPGVSVYEEVSLLDQMVSELRSGHVSDDTVQYLREEIGDSYQSRSVDVRVKQLQTDISDLRAYMNALEAFFDDHGSAENIIERFEARLDTFETDLEALETTVETQGTMIGTHREEIRTLQETVESMGDDVTAVQDDVEDLSADLTGVEADLDAYEIDSRFEEIEDEIADIARLQSNLKQVFQS
jgi:archaellum component FlaC